jgi:short-subunit dehydrogenase
MDLTGATALVTGANRGIGRALTQRLAAEPLRVVLAGMRSPRDFAQDRPDGRVPPPGADAGGSPGQACEVRPVHVDLSSRESIELTCAELGEDLSQIDLLINNAGLMTGGLLEEQDIEQVYAMLQVNLVAVVHLTQRVLPGMLERDRGLVVNNASISGYAHMPAASTYAASKAGVVAFSESLRRELHGTGVRVLHLVTPGVETQMLTATEELYGRHMDTTGWDHVPAEEWAERVIEAIKGDRRVLGPGGRSAVAKLLAAGPAFLLDGVSARAFRRRPRG